MKKNSYLISAAKLLTAIAGKEESDCTVKVMSTEWDGGIVVQKDEYDTTPIVVSECLVFINWCENHNLFPCISVAEDLSGRHVWFEWSNMQDCFTEFSFEVGEGCLVIRLKN